MGVNHEEPQYESQPPNCFDTWTMVAGVSPRPRFKTILCPHDRLILPPVSDHPLAICFKRPNKLIVHCQCEKRESYVTQNTDLLFVFHSSSLLSVPSIHQYVFTSDFEFSNAYIRRGTPHSVFGSVLFLHPRPLPAPFLFLFFHARSRIHARSQTPPS